MQRGADRGPYRERLRVDGSFYLELSFCNDHGIPHDEFLRWSPESRAKALAFLIEAGDRCGLCGTAGWEWEADKRAYVPIEHLCPGCYAKSALEEQAGGMPGTTVRLTPSRSTEAAVRLLKQRKEANRG